ncbi:histamine N-methyltransferase A-like isoform X2 [Hyperolius riggenbachi]|uniref:histamine N-methyltransferase A-like isoform X2 n=1 Tax=Hyperolius riggenbachi TaxID=752182 RepID=UPI0035A2D3F6
MTSTEDFPWVVYSQIVRIPSHHSMYKIGYNLSRATGLNNVTFSWHSKDVVQYEKDAKLNNNVKKFDLIHMIQMLYYVKPVKETLEFLKSCLSPEGKMVIVVLSGESGWNRMTRKYEWLWREEFNLGLNSEAVTDILEGLSMKYEIHDIDCFFDVTECLEEGNKAGEMLLDVLTDFARFAETAPPDHKAQVLADIQSPEFSIRKDGKVWFDTRLKGIVARL